jgi:glyoxylase-like metal-dependent hydrolase (beta-lactamase superfamily II)
VTKILKIHAGHYWSDGGAFLGVLPYAIWGKKIQTDEKRRKRLDLNLALIVTEDRRILIDTGLGNRLSAKQEEIYRPSAFALPAALAELGYRDRDITDIILTHLHFDHAGGIITGTGARDILTFPNATHWIQKDEWEMAKTPDTTNRAAYDFEHQLSLLDGTCKLKLIEGDVQIAEGITCVKSGGHSVGSQFVQIDSPAGFYIYAGDIIPTRFHTSAAITSAYDVCRSDTVAAKKLIYDRLKAKNGTLILNHDTTFWEIPISELKV